MSIFVRSGLVLASALLLAACTSDAPRTEPPQSEQQAEPESVEGAEPGRALDAVAAELELVDQPRDAAFEVTVMPPVHQPPEVEAGLASKRPLWLEGATPLSLERGVVGAARRFVVLHACTHCDVGDGSIGPLAPDLMSQSYVLFPTVMRTRPVLSPDERTIAVLACRASCASEGITWDLNPSVYLSRDGGWRWEERRLAEGIWRIRELEGDEVVLA